MCVEPFLTILYLSLPRFESVRRTRGCAAEGACSAAQQTRASVGEGEPEEKREPRRADSQQRVFTQLVYCMAKWRQAPLSAQLAGRRLLRSADVFLRRIASHSGAKLSSAFVSILEAQDELRAKFDFEYPLQLPPK